MSQRAEQKAPETRGKVIRWARFYDLVTNLMSFGRAKAIRRMTVELAGAAPGEKVLDVGCGTGTLTLLLKGAAGPEGEVHGIDAGTEMIEVAREKAAKSRDDVRFQVGLIEEIPFPDSSFDLVTSSLMLHHLPDDVKRKGFVEIRRVLKPGGRFLAVDLPSSQQSFIGHLMTLLGHRMDGTAVEKLAPMLGEAGFVDVEVGPTKSKPIWFLRGRA